jgi:hypothetical protein
MSLCIDIYQWSEQYQQPLPYQSTVSGTFSGGGNLSSRYLGGTFTGYDCIYSANAFFGLR